MTLCRCAIFNDLVHDDSELICGNDTFYARTHQTNVFSKK